MLKRLIARMRERSRQRMAAEYPVSAWIAQFETPEDLEAALRRGEGPER